MFLLLIRIHKDCNFLRNMIWTSLNLAEKRVLTEKTFTIGLRQIPNLSEKHINKFKNGRIQVQGMLLKVFLKQYI